MGVLGEERAWCSSQALFFLVFTNSANVRPDVPAQHNASLVVRPDVISFRIQRAASVGPNM